MQPTIVRRFDMQRTTIRQLTREVQEAVGILKFFNDGCGCVAICKDGPCPRCMARAFIARNEKKHEPSQSRVERDDKVWFMALLHQARNHSRRNGWFAPLYLTSDTPRGVRYMTDAVTSARPSIRPSSSDMEAIAELLVSEKAFTRSRTVRHGERYTYLGYGLNGRYGTPNLVSKMITLVKYRNRPV